MTFIQQQAEALQLPVRADGDTSNSWGLNLKDSGEATKTFNGDQHGRFIYSEVLNGTTYDVYEPTRWAADGSVIDGEVEADFNDVIVGSTGNDKIAGQGGNDALDGGAGNDEIDGGDGNDVIIGGDGSDTLKGGAGDDIILSAGDLTAPQDRRVHGWSPALANVGVAATQDDAPDVIDAGEGNDIVYAGRGDDRIEGGSGADVLWGLAGNDIIEGGTGDDQLAGDGVSVPGTYASTLGEMHGNDFLDGGEGADPAPIKNGIDTTNLIAYCDYSMGARCRFGTRLSANHLFRHRRHRNTRYVSMNTNPIKAATWSAIA